MALKSIHKTTRNDFDTEYVNKLLDDQTLSKEELERILSEACHLIIIERNKIIAINDFLRKTSNFIFYTLISTR